MAFDEILKIVAVIVILITIVAAGIWMLNKRKDKLMDETDAQLQIGKDLFKN